MNPYSNIHAATPGHTFILAACLMLGVPLFPPPAWSGACGQWGPPTVAGILDSNRLREVSGITASRRFPQRLYHVNDSGADSRLYITDLEGNHTQDVRIDRNLPLHTDVEDISVGPCGKGRDCIFIADTGDNTQQRENLQIVVVEERRSFPDTVIPTFKLRFTYPDAAHNAEGLAVHPDGDIYIVTKELKKGEKPGILEKLRGEKRTLLAAPARLYRLPKESWLGEPDKQHVLTFVGEIDLPRLLQQHTRWPYAHIATGFSIAPDGKRFLLLTYEFVIEFDIDLGAGPLPESANLVEGKDFRLIESKRLPFQEGITYLSDGHGLFYHTERRNMPQELIRIDCDR